MSALVSRFAREKKAGDEAARLRPRSWSVYSRWFCIRPIRLPASSKLMIRGVGYAVADEDPFRRLKAYAAGQVEVSPLNR